MTKTAKFLIIPLFATVCCTTVPSHEVQSSPPPAQPVTDEEETTPSPTPHAAPILLRAPPEGFVDLATFIPGLRLDIRYHTADNFTGAPVTGYGAPGAWFLEKPARALGKVQEELQEQGYGLLVYDAYRPRRGTLAMVAWAERTGQEHLLNNGYIARRSGHNHGNTIDLTLVDAQTGAVIDMGTPWDTLTKRSHTFKVEGEALQNRLILKRAMENHGFTYYFREWWHFQMKMEGTRFRDVPYSCFEADEGNWTAPSGWATPGYSMPSTWSKDARCPSQ